MTKISNVKVYDLKESVIASRNAMRTSIPDYTDEEFERSMPRAIKLVQASANDDHVKCHDNFLTGIRVSFDIVYPQYISPELQRYHFVDIVTSSSKMHKMMHRTAEDACNEYVSAICVSQLHQAIDRYNRIADEISRGEIKDHIFLYRSGRQITASGQDALYYARMFAISNCPSGYELFMRCSTNYKQLQTIYWQRKNHRLREDWGAICDFIKSLPYSKEFITGDV